MAAAKLTIQRVVVLSVLLQLLTGRLQASSDSLAYPHSTSTLESNLIQYDHRRFTTSSTCGMLPRESIPATQDLQ
eukprot:5099573-Amphidinium_carterae.1